MVLINADELWKHKFKSASERMDLNVTYMGGWNDAIDSIVENALAVDAVLVRHGRWVHGIEVGREYLGDCLVGIFYDRWTCSECGYVVDDHEYSGINYKFCPNCGAKMDGGADDA